MSKKSEKTVKISLAFLIFLSNFFLYRCAQEPTGGNQQQQEQEQQQQEQENQQQQQQQFIPTYSKDVKPIIDGKCISCHSPNGTAQFAPLTNYQEIVNGTAKGPSCSGTQNKNYVVKGNADMSLLYLKITTPPCGSKMPPGGSLSQDEIETIKKWIQNGAPESGT
jgi:mono/diheme cytochrome c family protein